MDALHTYIQQARQQGWDNTRIRDSLLASGWQPAQIDPALGTNTAVPAPPPAVQPNPVYAQPNNGQLQPAASSQNQQANTDENPDKNYLVALLLSHFLGGIGADRFYLSKTGTAIAKLLTFGGLGIWTLIDTLLIAFGKLTAKDDPRKLEGYAKNRDWVKIVAIIFIVFNVLVGVGIFLAVVLGSIASLQQHSQETQRQNQYQQQLQDQQTDDYQRSFN